jgi:hypothetical protein
MTSMEAHLTSWLGEPTAVRQVSLGTQSESVSLLRIDDSPWDGATTLATAGLADLGGHRLHEELLVACWSDGPVNALASVVEFLVRQLTAGREPLLYGDVVGPAGPLVPGTSMDAIYVCEPTYYPSGFARFVSPEGCVIRTRWLVPIYASEAQVVGDKGAGALEDMLVEQDPDLLSLQRGPVAL